MVLEIRECFPRRDAKTRSKRREDGKNRFGLLRCFSAAQRLSGEDGSQIQLGTEDAVEEFAVRRRILWRVSSRVAGGGVRGSSASRDR